MNRFEKWWAVAAKNLIADGKDDELTLAALEAVANIAWAACEQQFRPQWQPIETAPKGVYSLRRTDPEWVQPPLILLFIPGCTIYPEGHKVAALWDYYYDKDIGGRGYEGNKTAWVTPYGELVEDNYDGVPTHWMHLPAAPQGDEK